MDKQIQVKQIILKRKFILSAMLLSITVGIVISGINPYIYGKIIDHITLKNVKGLRESLIFFFITMISLQLLAMIENSFSKIMSSLTEIELKQMIFQKILFKKCKKIDEYTAGELLNRLEFEVSSTTLRK